MASKAELIDAVLQDLGVLYAGQTADASDAALVERRLEAVLADLAQRNVIYVPPADDIDDQVFQLLTDILVETCAPAFGRGREYQVIERAESRLRTIARIGKGVPGARLKVDRSLLGASRRQGRL